MYKILALWTACLMPLEAVALSCAAPAHPIDTLNKAHKTPDQSVVGYVTFLDNVYGLSVAQSSISSDHAMTGLLFQDGATTTIDETIARVNTSCIAATWCGNGQHFIKDTGYLVEFDRDPQTGALSISSGPCEKNVVIQINAPDLEKLAQCLSDGDCSKADVGL